MTEQQHYYYAVVLECEACLVPVCSHQESLTREEAHSLAQARLTLDANDQHAVPLHMCTSYSRISASQYDLIESEFMQANGPHHPGSIPIGFALGVVGCNVQ